MIIVTLPESNNLLDDINDDVLKKICNILFGTSLFTTERVVRRTGRYVTFRNSFNNEIHYVCFSNPHNDSRNAHLMQFISPTFTAFHKDPSSRKNMDIYLLHPDSNDDTPYIRLFYRCFKTLGIALLNAEAARILPQRAFSDYEDLKRYRAANAERNTHNRQTYFIDDSNQISVYGKTFGANAMESFILALTIARIVDKKVMFYPVIDNESRNISVDQRLILEEAGIVFGETINELGNDTRSYTSRSIDSLRDTPKFHYNLLKKYGEKRCYLCGCDLEHMIIGSHIERVTDIQRSASYTLEEKIKRIVDGDNGFWLCANHDKLFEYGTIFFIKNALAYAQKLDSEAIKYIETSIYDVRALYFRENKEKTFTINPAHYNSNMEQYINEHLLRISP